MCPTYPKLLWILSSPSEGISDVKTADRRGADADPQLLI
jgi:hypothetical protein